MNILIVGAGGFIGSHLSEEILRNRRDWHVTAVDISSAKIEHLLSEKKIDFKKIDILKDFDRLEELIKQCDVIFPLAAIASPLVYVQDPLKVFELDFEANLRIIRSAVRHDKRVVFPSTSEVYGMCEDGEFKEDDSNCVTGPICKQRWIYSCSKQMLDRVIYAHGVRDGLRYTLFRPFNWIGPRLDDIYNQNSGSSRVVSQFLSNILHGKNINLVNGGSQIRCFTYISDGIDALVKIIESERANRQIFNIGNPHNECSIGDLARKIVSLAKKYDWLKNLVEKIEIVNVNSDDYYGKSYQDVSRRVPSIKKAKDLLDWESKVGMDESLTKTMDFYFADPITTG
ncbi:MAG: bifunctional UDP-4-keto-pentose/UDP-xylose synthase [Holosporaceae bacterium]|jgi:nucleoside-diphosphate-sugar epimerase|nr:bifunctional UDP-4-keto-pentose/UDP-xylose synthase [Holosporaceae bacterium]